MVSYSKGGRVEARGFSVTRAGLIAAAFGAGSVLSGPVSGFAADRFGRRPVLLLSLGLSAAFTALLATLSSRWAIGSAVLAPGVAGSPYRPVASAVIAGLVPPRARPRPPGGVLGGVRGVAACRRKSAAPLPAGARLV